ncbi:MAG: hypothetical protein ACD_76C00073G0002 [uncultured bacterium]|nr:MAG: hypothetical protein ACD_76C00073G0002 [uncultured bacterium]HBD04840.1 hypothetical protein [Candidatus Uhrbacteria bacterium]
MIKTSKQHERNDRTRFVLCLLHERRGDGRWNPNANQADVCELSEAGCFVATHRRPTVGTELMVVLPLAENMRVAGGGSRITCTVVLARKHSSGREGFDVSFTAMNDESANQLKRLLRQIRFAGSNSVIEPEAESVHHTFHRSSVGVEDLEGARLEKTANTSRVRGAK